MRMIGKLVSIDRILLGNGREQYPPTRTFLLKSRWPYSQYCRKVWQTSTLSAKHPLYRFNPLYYLPILPNIPTDFISVILVDYPVSVDAMSFFASLNWLLPFPIPVTDIDILEHFQIQRSFCLFLFPACSLLYMSISYGLVWKENLFQVHFHLRKHCRTAGNSFSLASILQHSHVTMHVQDFKYARSIKLWILTH
jgi:hypothetical protein